MIGGFGWPDLVIVVVLALTAFKGFARGFINELGGAVATIAGLIAPWYYNGSADAQIDHFTKFGPGPSHVVGMILTGILAYVVVLVAAAILNRFAKLPILGLGNAIAGAVVGFAKGVILLWLVLFIALFFPLTHEIRAALHGSQLAAYLMMFNGVIIVAIQNVIPAFARNYLTPFFASHHL